MGARTTVLLAVLAVCAAPGPYAVEVTFSGTSVSVSAEGVEARGDFHTGEVAFKGGGIELSGAGQLLVVRPDGWVSSLLMGGADRSVGGSDKFGVQLSTKAAPAILALADPEGRDAGRGGGRAKRGQTGVCPHITEAETGIRIGVAGIDTSHRVSRITR